MEMDMNAMKSEVGGAFVLSWLVLGMGLGTLEGAVALAAVWMAFGGAHVLPIMTWCHMMTGDLGDVDGNWMPNGMRLVAQAIGALLAIVLMTKAGDIETGWMATEFAAPDAWGVVGSIAAGAIFWTIHTRADSAWVSAFAVMAMAGVMTLNGAHEMGASLASSGEGIADVAPAWIVDGLLVGAGAFIGGFVDDAI